MSASSNKLVLLSLILILLPWELFSQEDTAKFQTEEIIVTGTRIEQKLIDIPFSVQRVAPSEWITSRKQSVSDVLTSVPGLFLQSRYGNHDVRVTIRGYGSRSNTGIRGVRILLDGIPESEPDGQTRVEALDFSAIGKIEIVKGNSSSLYTNAPGGVINFFTDKYFLRTFVQSDNEFGSFDLRKNGLKVGVNAKNSRFMFTGSYENYHGYRQHSQEYQNRLNTLYEADVTDKSKLAVYGYYVNGLIKLPGSLTLQQFNENDTAANQRSIDRDEKRISKKGRIGITYNNAFGKNNNHLIEVTTYGTIKDLERTARTYRIFTRYGLGSSFRYINKMKIANRTNEFSVGGDLYYQTGPISEFVNRGGQKEDELRNLNNETISNVGFYFVEQFPIIKDRLSILATGRYDRVVFAAANLQNAVQDTSITFADFTPKFALNLKLTRNVAVYTSFGLSFDSPANNEMDNPETVQNPNAYLLNLNLKPQRAQHVEGGFKGSFAGIQNKYFTKTFAELTVFHSRIKDAIVPYVLDVDVFFRNAALVSRTGVEAGITTEIYKGFSLKGAYTYSRYKYLEYDALVIDSNFIEHHKDFSGNFEPSNPEHLLSVDLGYQHTIKKITLFAKANLQYVGSMFVNDANTDSLKTEPYTLLNGQVGIDAKIGGFRIMVYGGLNNILDKKYAAYININSDRYEFYEAGPRRNFFGGVTLAYVFR